MNDPDFLFLPHKDATRTVTRKQWQKHCAKFDLFTMVQGYGYWLTLRSLGGGIYEIYLKPHK